MGFQSEATRLKQLGKHLDRGPRPDRHPFPLPSKCSLHCHRDCTRNVLELQPMAVMSGLSARTLGAREFPDEHGLTPLSWV